VNDLIRKKPGRPQSKADAERRKIGTVVHDDRGNASVSWRDAPSNLERPVLEVLGDPKLSIKSDDTFDPYAHRPARGSSGGNGGSRGPEASGSGRTDLRKLSEWIKMMRELEQRKRDNGGGQEQGG
jgi:hypothetical protein